MLIKTGDTTQLHDLEWEEHTADERKLHTLRGVKSLRLQPTSLYLPLGNHEEILHTSLHCGRRRRDSLEAQPADQPECSDIFG